MIQLLVRLWFPHGLPSCLRAGCLALEADIFEARGRQRFHSRRSHRSHDKVISCALCELTGIGKRVHVCADAGQRVCKAGKGKPCYKLAYFSELRRRLNFEDAALACRRDGGQLLSVESTSEQKIIEQLITELRPTDGDFWIGLRRNRGGEDSSSNCSLQYYWLDGSKSTFRWVGEFQRVKRSKLNLRAAEMFYGGNVLQIPNFVNCFQPNEL